jgi:hypothetical protein
MEEDTIPKLPSRIISAEGGNGYGDLMAWKIL